MSGNDLIVRGSSLDFEDIQEYRFNVTARDRGMPFNRSTEALVVVRVTDLNDNSPIFRPDRYSTNVDEGNYADNSTAIVRVSSLPYKHGINNNDCIFLKVNATDIDSAEFGNVSYVIFPENPFFSVTKLDSGEGEVRAEGELDRELEDSYTITILARDGGQNIHTFKSTDRLHSINADVPPNTATATVSVMVNDVNDNDPILTENVYTAIIPEESGPQDLNTDVSVI